MKLFTISLLFIGGLLLSPANTNAQKSAVEYMDDLMSPLNEFKSETWQYLKSVTRGKSARKIDKKRQKLISEVGRVKKIISSKDGYEGDSELKDALNKYMDMNYTVLKEDYDKILDMEEIAEQSYDLMEAYLLAKEKAGEKMDEAGDLLMKAQKDFAEKHNINLIEGEDDKTTEKIKKAGQTLTYYNDLYLIFFKAYKQEAYVLDAMGKNDVNAIQQNNNSLKSVSEEGMAKLKEVKDFNGDKSLIEECNKILQYYIDESEGEFTKIVDFYVTKDNFEKVKANFDAKKEKNRTKEDVDKYNNAANEYNNAVNSYNQHNDAANTKRSKALDDWNKSVESFFDKHSK